MLNILTIDTGTSSQRGVLYNSKGQVMFNHQLDYSPIYCEDGKVEQSPKVWRNSLIDIIGKAVDFCNKNSIKIDAISVTSQRSSLIPVDEKGEHLSNAIMWQDSRTQGICDEFEPNSESIYIKTGMNVTTILTVVKSVWLKRNEPELYKRTYKLIGVHEFILKMLTDLFITDQSIANRSGLFNVEKCQWDDELIHLYDIDKNKLCDVIPPGKTCGTVSNKFAKLTGLTEGIPVISAGGDQQCAVLGLNATEAGSVGANTGTASYLIGCVDKPYIDPNRTIVCNVSGIEGKWIVESSLPTSGTIFRWFNKEFYGDVENQESIYTKISEEIRESTIGANGVVMLPYFKGCNLPKWNPCAKGGFFNVTLANKRCDFARAILEGIASEMNDALNYLEKGVGEFGEISISGGLTQLNEFNQIQCDMYGKQLTKYKFHESTSLGAWMSAAKELGIFATLSDAFKSVAPLDETQLYNPIEKNCIKYKEYKATKFNLKDMLCLN